ncbi:contractile injection system tape measure protein [Dyadobacter psychrophilus]|uniref:Uncharacterized protein n=1 Tax=Dyadobacter psychrophilus TaxID=651661 RepID=A0A1T5DKZ9_9BACT|nr:contractile injection system tape measure protein [Dyadobacter psychrophilus]SKB72220.1 hypothetical protein SAMN05660293_01690 [Dyadobacter psychrophilus]
MSQTHVINSLQIEIETSDESTAFRLRDALNHYWQQWVMLHLEKAFDKVSPVNAMIRIDKLELDLETLEAENFDDDFPERIEKLFSDRLQKIIHSKSISHLISNNSATDQDLLVSFLKTGALPWWSQSYKDIDFNRIIYTTSVEKPEEMRDVLLNAFKGKDSLLRLLYQFDNQIIINILRSLFGMDGHEGEIEKRIEFWQNKGKALAESETDMFRVLAFFAHLNKVENLNAGSSLQAVSERFLPFAKQNEWRQFSGSSLEMNALTDAILQVESASQDKEELSEEQTKYVIRHAGIVLIAPFLPQLFRQLNLLADEGGTFRDEQAALRAVALLGYIGRGKSVVPEYELILEKLLCGVPIHEPVPLDCALTLPELQEADELLNAVIGHWNVLKSVSGLREGFFERDGILQDMGSSWLLRVERKSYDVLFDHKPPPWGFRVLRFSWNPKMIETEW